MNFSPLHDRVLVKRLASEEKTAGGIIIPDTAQEKPQEGKVVAVAKVSPAIGMVQEIVLQVLLPSVPPQLA